MENFFPWHGKVVIVFSMVWKMVWVEYYDCEEL